MRNILFLMFIVCAGCTSLTPAQVINSSKLDNVILVKVDMESNTDASALKAAMTAGKEFCGADEAKIIEQYDKEFKVGRKDQVAGDYIIKGTPVTSKGRYFKLSCAKPPEI